jgi:hypothetical protein
MYNNIVYDKGNQVAIGPSAVTWNFKGGRLVLLGNGTWGGTALWIQWTPDGSTFFTLGPQNGVGPLTTDGSAMFYLPPGRYRTILSGGAGVAIQYAIGDANTGA